jgi:hypothetical protein
MAKRVYFCFHYQDVIDFRANVVRNHWLTKNDREAAGFFDASIWETAKKTSDLAVKRLINKGLENTTVSCVLVGSQTYGRRWVSYEIMKGMREGNKIFAVHINKIKGKDEKTKNIGPNPLYYLGYQFSQDGKTIHLYDFVDSKWVKYSDLDSYSVKQVDEMYRNKIYRLSNDHPIYDWIDDDGYNNFLDWVG